MGICSSRVKSVSQITKLNSRPKKLSGVLKNLVSKISKEEFVLIQLLFNDLVKKSTGESINKETFLSVYQLPVIFTKGLLGERLFYYFDTKRIGLLDFECFLAGLLNYCASPIDRKFKIIFDLCDLKNDLNLDLSELLVIRTLLGPEILTRTELPENEIVNPVRTRRRSKTAVKNLESKEEVLSVNDQIQNWINIYGDGESISYVGFQNLLKVHQQFHKKFEEAFNSKIWSIESLDSTLSLLPRKSFSNSQISGELFVKVGDKLVHQHAILRDKVLLLYEHINSKYPDQMIHMEGCYAEIIGDFYISNKYGILITHQNTNYGEIMLWSDSRKERDDWLRYLELVSNHRKFKEFYSLGEKIGQGKFSDVYICTEHKSYKKWAVKVINKQKLSALEKELLSSEIKILKLLDHPNIVKIKEIFDSKKHILIVMELIEGGELFELIQRKKVFSEFTASKIVRQLLEALVYLHNLGILHRDIKPENILLTDDSDIPQIKLADFGLSKLSGPNDVQILACGTLGYVAPEVLTQEGYTFKADLWSVGIITYLLLRGRLPFDHKDKKVLIDLTVKANLSFEDPYWKAFTVFALDFISKLINKSQVERYSPKEALDHQWMKNADILIPRAIDKKKMEDLFIEKGVTSSNFGNFQYKEIEVNIDDNLGVSYDVRSMPDLYEEFESPIKVDDGLVLVHSVVD